MLITGALSASVIEATDASLKVCRRVAASWSTWKLSEPADAPDWAEIAAALELDVAFMPPQVSLLPSAVAAAARLESLLFTLW
ncbi:hypothetical protein GCM10020358_04860 [Amorphoplanes nipponensis]